MGPFSSHQPSPFLFFPSLSRPVQGPVFSFRFSFLVFFLPKLVAPCSTLLIVAPPSKPSHHLPRRCYPPLMSCLEPDSITVTAGLQHLAGALGRATLFVSPPAKPWSQLSAEVSRASFGAQFPTPPGASTPLAPLSGGSHGAAAAAFGGAIGSGTVQPGSTEVEANARWALVRELVLAHELESKTALVSTQSAATGTGGALTTADNAAAAAAAQRAGSPARWSLLRDLAAQRQLSARAAAAGEPVAAGGGVAASGPPAPAAAVPSAGAASAGLPVVADAAAAVDATAAAAGEAAVGGAQ